MNTIESVIAANEEFVAALEAFNSVSKSKGFKGFSFALEEAQEDVKDKAKEGLLVKIKAFIAKVIAWFKEKFTRSPKESKKAAEESLDEFMKEMQENFDEFFEEGEIGELDIDEIAVKKVLDAGVVQDRALSCVVQEATLCMLLAQSGSISVTKTIDNAEQLAQDLQDFTTRVEKLPSLSKEELVREIVALGSEMRNVSATIQKQWGKEAVQAAVKLCGSCDANAMLKELGKIEALASRSNKITDVATKMASVVEFVDAIDFSDLSGDQAAASKGAQEIVSALMQAAIWANRYASYGVDAKLKYLGRVRSSAAGKEKLDKISQELIAEYKVSQKDAMIAAGFAIGVAQMRLME